MDLSRRIEYIMHIYIYNMIYVCITSRSGQDISTYPPTPAFAKAGAAPGTTAGVELVFLSNRHPKAISMASSGRPSLPFARP